MPSPVRNAWDLFCRYTKKLAGRGHNLDVAAKAAKVCVKPILSDFGPSIRVQVWSIESTVVIQAKLYFFSMTTFEKGVLVYCGSRTKSVGGCENCYNFSNLSK